MLSATLGMLCSEKGHLEIPVVGLTDAEADSDIDNEEGYSYFSKGN